MNMTVLLLTCTCPPQRIKYRPAHRPQRMPIESLTISSRWHTVSPSLVQYCFSSCIFRDISLQMEIFHLCSSQIASRRRGGSVCTIQFSDYGHLVTPVPSSWAPKFGFLMFFNVFHLCCLLLEGRYSTNLTLRPQHLAHICAFIEHLGCARQWDTVGKKRQKLISVPLWQKLSQGEKTDI